MSFKAALLAGSKGGGGSDSYRNTPDNLRSTDTFEILLGLGTGRMRLAPGGLQNMFVNDVRVEDEAGNATFTDFTVSLFDGDPTNLQPVKLNLGSSSGQTTVALALSNPNASAPGDWVNATITQTGVDFIDLRFVVQELYSQTKNGVGNATANIEVQLRPAGATNWINPITSTTAPTYNPNGIGGFFGALFYILRSKYDAAGTNWKVTNPAGSSYFRISGKTTSTYVKEFRIAVPNDGNYANKTWDVRCRLIEKDDVVSGANNENETKRTIVWESIAGVSMAPIGGTEAWRGLSYIQLFGKATDQINGVPTLTSICDLDLYPVPPSTVWDPETRVYTGAAWDGVTTQLAWTQCPAWQIKKLIEDDLSGVSALAPGSTLNKWDVLEASKWFATQVPDGNGGTQPRYSANWFIDQPQSINELVNYLAGAVGAHAWDEGDGKWRLKVEKPETPQVIFTKENIVGEFNYQHTDIDSRFNSITAVYRDRDNRYLESRVRVFNQADIDATGLRHTTITLVGCDNRQEALRRAYIRLLTGLNEIRIVTFKTNRVAGTLEQFSVIGVADGDLNASRAIRSTGRIVDTSSDMTRVTVRDTLRLEAGVAYTVNLTIPNPDYTPDTSTEPTSDEWRKPTITITRNIVNTAAQRGDVYDLYLDSALPSTLPEFAVVALEATGLPALPKQYRVLDIKPDDGGEFATITALEIYTSKWVESDAVTEASITSQISTKIVDPPTIPDSGMFRLDTYSSGTTNRRVLVANWVRPAGRFIDGYQVSYSYNGGPWNIVAKNTQDTFYEIRDPAPGDYAFQIVTNDRRGLFSVPLTGTVSLDDNAILPPVGYLTNESHTVAAAADGTGFSLSQAGGQFMVYSPLGLIPSSELTFSVLATSGATATIDASGVYTITGLTADTATITFRAVWSNYAQPVDKVYTITKSRAGAAGSSAKLLYIISDRQTIAYDKDGNPVPSVQTVTFKVQKQNTANPVNWTITDANGVAQDPSVCLSDTSGDTVTMTVSQFATARNGTSGVIVKGSLTDGVTLSDQISVVQVKAGADGAPGAPGTPGANGLNAAQVLLYQRAAAAPAVPSVTTTYTFSTAFLSGVNNGWSQSIPASNGNPLWVTAASAIGSGSTDTIGTAEWAAPVIMAQDGSGGAGSNGLNSATVYLFQRKATAPAVPSVSTTYTFASGVLTGQDNGWQQTVPATNGNPLWVTTATALGTGSTDNISTSEWAAPSIMAQDGATGQAAINVGLSTYSVTVAADYTNVTKAGQLPKTSTLKVLQGSTDITGSCTIALTPSDGTAINANYSGGLVSVTKADSAGYVDVQVSQGATVLATPRLQIVRVADQPPPGSLSGAPGSGNIFADGSGGTSGPFPTTPTTPTILLKPNASGQLRVTLSGDYNTDDPNPLLNYSITVQAKAIYRVAGSGSAYSDFGVAVTGTSASYTKAGGEFTPGSIGLDQTKSGLTSSTTYEIGFVFRKSAGSSGNSATGTCNFSVQQP